MSFLGWLLATCSKHRFPSDNPILLLRGMGVFLQRALALVNCFELSPWDRTQENRRLRTPFIFIIRNVNSVTPHVFIMRQPCVWYCARGYYMWPWIIFPLTWNWCEKNKISKSYFNLYQLMNSLSYHRCPLVKVIMCKLECYWSPTSPCKQHPRLLSVNKARQL